MLRIESLSKTYKGGKRAVDNLSLHIEPGDIYGFIGHNGAGKTTTLLACTGILDFEQGNIYISGKSIKDQPVECKKEIAFIPDNPDLYEYLTGIQYLNFICDIFEVSKSTRSERIEKYAEVLELLDNLGDLISSYSHGMKQKLALISALVHSPKLLILDEPFVGLDPKSSHTLKQMMHQMCENGCAIFFSTHVLDVAEKLCNKIAIIKNGQLIASGETDEVRGKLSLEEVFLEMTDDE
ncbi:MAG: ABC transporter ATP-binding protein [Oscillospiraceae bacterium]|nr:ABC transporter ATP-binding protein [Oscillospiraceae bacterium]